MIKLYGNQCVSVVVKVKQEKLYIRRSKVRFEEMSINPYKNTYVQNYPKIAIISQHILR